MNTFTFRSLRSIAIALCLTVVSSTAWAGGFGHSWLSKIFDDDFGPAANVTGINSDAADGCPIESPDGLSLVIASKRGTGGDNDLWAADRASVDEPWGAPLELPSPINSAAGDFCPTPVSDRSLFFVSSRDAACDGGNIYLSRQGIGGQWSEPELLPCAPQGPNFDGAIFSPSLVESRRGTFLFYSADGKFGEQDIYVSRRGKDGQYGPGRRVAALSLVGEDDRMPNVRYMGKGLYEVVFSSTREGGTQDVYRAVSWAPPFRWTKPVKLGPNVNTEDGSETRATLSRDGERLYFGRGGEIFMSER
ncbi:MAG: hypothetical protein U5Q16_08745 [Gammaproteobacteria bacterium]|nr:hypothetical protein [Gammaproteobacteria bacterium]